MSHAIPIKSKVSCKGKRTSDRNVSTVTVSAEGTMTWFCIDTFCPHTVTFDPSLRLTTKVKSCGSIWMFLHNISHSEGCKTVDRESFSLSSSSIWIASLFAISFCSSFPSLSIGFSLAVSQAERLIKTPKRSSIHLFAFFPCGFIL